MKRKELFAAVLGTGKRCLPLCLFALLPFSLMAQDDDMYFVPTKENVAKEAKKYGMPKDTYYSGSQRSVDDYNRRAWSTVTPVDSAGNDIIEFSAVRGVYPDSAYTEVQEDNDYQLTRRMSRFDDYAPAQAYWDGYRAGRWSSPWYSSYYSWYDPWYYDSWYYWNDPWYYTGWHGGWYSPWYYGGWYSPWHYGYYGHHGWYGGGWYGGGYRGTSGRGWSRTGISHHKTPPSTTNRRTNGSLGGYRSSTYQNGGTSTRSYGTNSGSLGGTRSSSSWSGGSRSSMGGSRSSAGSSGGGRSVGGGHSYGGRR